MIDDMRLRQYGAKTQHDYVREVAAFARFFGRSPDQAEPEDLRRHHAGGRRLRPSARLAATGARRNAHNPAPPDRRTGG